VTISELTVGRLADDAFYDILLNGALEDAGMASFGVVPDRAKADEIRAYLIHRANVDKAASTKN